MRGPAGYGRYDDDPQHVGCPWAKSDMTPCIARDGNTALSDDRQQVCVGCGHTPSYLVGDLAGEYAPAKRQPRSGNPGRAGGQVRGPGLGGD